MATKIKLGKENWGVKENGLLAYNDEDNIFKAIELQSSRASGATYVGEDGLIKDAEVGVPRIDWTNGVGELLLEPQSTNLLPYSEDYSQSVYTRRNCNITANYAISPDGAQNATRVVATGADAAIFDNIGVSSGTTYTLSVYLRVESGTLDTTISLGSAGFPNTSGDGGRVKNITVTTEWQRFTLTSTADANAGSDIGVIGGFGGFNNGDSVLIWGAQLEQLSYPTSYIRNNGNVAGVTRIADAVTGNSSLGSVINSSEGVLYFEGSCLVDDEGDRRISLSDGSASVYRLTFDSSGRIFAVAYNGGSNQCVLVFDTDLTQNFKCAFKYKQNDFALWVNGVEVDTDPSGSVSSSINELSFDAGLSTSAKFFGKVKDLRVYDVALTDSELQNLTTL